MKHVLEVPSVTSTAEAIAVGGSFISEVVDLPEAVAADHVLEAQPDPDAPAITAAREEYNGLFVYVDDETKVQNTERYRQGLQDVLVKDGIKRDTPAAQFYVHVQELMDLANRAYDHPRS